ncbi:hypothetical protein ABZ508_34380 [Streptomyces lavendulocolor]|uniref:Integral membrane protein n=1 Tax=Streptomyces lavendulocolor TaxID=67316 RepID=A0ABV2WGH2_9ACTN
MPKLFHLAAPQDLSTGFADFFKTIGLTGGGLVTKGVAAVIAVIAVKMLLTLSADPKTALRKGGMAIGTLFVALVLALYGDALFGTVGGPAPAAPKG